MTKINLLLVTDSLNLGGIESYIINTCQFLDRQHFSITVAVLDKNRKASAQEVISYGCQVVDIEGKTKLQQMTNLGKIMRHQQINLVHFHVRHSHLMFVSKLLGRKVILHSHFASWQAPKRQFKRALLKLFLRLVCDARLACSQQAGQNAFLGLSYQVVANGLDFAKFAFNRSARERLRKELQLANHKILLQVGRINDNKNQLFSVRVLEQLLAQDESWVLLLVGDYDTGYRQVSQLVAKLQLEDKVIFADNKNNISEYYSVADALINPSLTEGFPFVPLEAQASGLPCFLSDIIVPEVSITKQTRFISLDQDPVYWAEKITELVNKKLDRIKIKLNQNYEITSTINKLAEIYRRTCE